ncbi:MAG TPA: hypothetical protein VFY39_12965 [Gammaproteobacteria bacterium]|nr:hypothetical protein [Gammaproteobacteria bacterium]
MGVKVIQSGTSAACSAADYVRVSAWCDPEQETLTLATIQRVVRRSQDGQAPSKARRIKTLLAKQPMSPDDALVLARCYAEHKQIPLIVKCTQLDEREDSQIC